MMYRCALFFAVLLLCGWTHGSAVVRTQVNIVSTYGATCNGTDDTAAFVAFTAANQGSTPTTLTIPNGASCRVAFNSTTAFWVKGVRDLIVSGYGASITVTNSQPMFFGGRGQSQDNLHSLRIASANIGDTCVTQAGFSPTATVSNVTNNGQGKMRLTVNATAGFTSFTTVYISGITGGQSDTANGNQYIQVIDGTTIDLPQTGFQTGYTSGGSIGGDRTSLATVGQYALVTGYDLQGIWGTPFGFPSNPHYLDFVKIASVNSSTHQICFTSALTNKYLSTWPQMNAGSKFEVDNGGPATVYFFDASWDAQYEYQGLTVTQASGQQSYSNARSVKWTDVTFPSTDTVGPIPSQNLVWTASNVSCPNCDMEVDKLIGTYTVAGSTWSHIKTQSSSNKSQVISNTTVTTDIQGTGKAASFSNVTTPTLNVGSFSYGRSDSFNCTGCVVTTAMGAAGVLDNGPGGGGANNSYTMASGIITIPNGALVVGAVDNGAGLVRLTVQSSAGFVTGKLAYVQNVGGISGINNQTWQLIVIDGTHVDLVASTFSGAYTAGGSISMNGPPRWAVPGTYFTWSGAQESETLAQVQTVTQDANSTYVQTSLAGSFPGVPLTSGKLNIRVHPAPSFGCPSCSGSANAVDWAQQTPGTPMLSYSKRIYDGNIGTARQPVFPLWGNVSQLTMNVTTAYAGAGALSFNNILFYNSSLRADYSTLTYNPSINMKVAGSRVVTVGGVTCNGGAGSCSLDSGLSLGGLTTWFTGSQDTGSIMSASAAGASPLPVISVEAIMDQGITWPPAFP